MGNKLDLDYQNLVRTILYTGRVKTDRTNTGTVSIFSHDIRHDMADGFPLLTTKKMSLKNIKTELYWFLQGGTNIKFLVDRGCNIWNGDAYKNYLIKSHHITLTKSNMSGWGILGDDGFMKQFTLEQFVDNIKSDEVFAKEWGELGPIYGKQWRDWCGIDQIKQLVDDILENPDSRRLKVEAWNVGEIDKMVLPPCHTGFQCYTEELTYKERYDIWFDNNEISEYTYNPNDSINFDLTHYNKTPTRRLSLKWIQRSVDTGLGLPYNIASYGLLLLMLADEVGMVPGELVGSLTNVHIYSDQVELIKEQLGREPYILPKVIVRDGINSHCDGDDIILLDYNSHPPIKLPLSN